MKNPKLFFQTSDKWRHTEITLLDLFAGMAMAGIADGSNFTVGAEKADESLAFRAYEIAQAMLEERENILKGESNA